MKSPNEALLDSYLSHSPELIGNYELNRVQKAENALWPAYQTLNKMSDKDKVTLALALVHSLKWKKDFAGSVTNSYQLDAEESLEALLTKFEK